MKVLVTGVAGQLGHDVICELLAQKIEVIGTDIVNTVPDLQVPYFPMDITDQASVSKAISEIQADAVIHCAAWTAVDAAEDPQNQAKVFAINEQGTKYIAQACKDTDTKMMYISTDYVFNGQGDTPWQPDCQHYAPLNIYGQSKLAGEQAVRSLLDHFFIVRIAWVFGLHGNNFIKTMLKIAQTHDTIRVVNDQIGTPTYTKDLAKLLVQMIQTDKYGYYHATNEGGYISWYDFACEIFRQAQLPVHVIPVSTQEYGQSKAQRPFNSRLDKTKLVQNGFIPLPAWQDALKRYLQEITQYGTNHRS